MKICFEMLRALHRYPLNLKIFYLSVGAAAIGKCASASLILSCLLPLSLLQDARGSETRLRAYSPTRYVILINPWTSPTLRARRSQREEDVSRGGRGERGDAGVTVILFKPDP